MQIQPRETLGFFVMGGGVLLAAWVVFGRHLFGVGGELTLVYALTLGIAIVVLHAFAGRAVVRTVRRGHHTRPATIGMLIASWGCGILLGLMIADVTPAGLQTILTGPNEPGLGIAIGVSNPLGIVMLVTSIVALALAVGDSKGAATPAEEDE